MCGKVNFTNLSRYSDLSERTYRRQYARAFNFVGWNAALISQAIPAGVTQIGSMDCSFIPKSGKATWGLDWFYNGSASRSEQGLEISVFAVIDVGAHRGYALSVQQTPANSTPAAQRSRKSKSKQHQKTRIDAAVIAQVSAELNRLPHKKEGAQSQGETEHLQPEASGKVTRIDHYLQHLKDTQPNLPQTLKYLVVDGFYSKRKFVDGVVEANLQMVGKLRRDANLRYLYDGCQKSRGRPRKYDGKVDFSDITRLSWSGELEVDLNLYTAVVWHVSLKRRIRIACLVDTRKPGKTGLVVLFSTDIELDAEQMVVYYKARFQIEFIFRDSKQFTGLGECQSRHPQKLDFHFNASLSALNLAKYEAQLQQHASTSTQKAEVFSMASRKRAAFNTHLLERFISQLDLNPTVIKSHPNYENLRSYGILAA